MPTTSGCTPSRPDTLARRWAISRRRSRTWDSSAPPSTWTVGCRGRPEAQGECMVGQSSYLGVVTGDWVSALKSSNALDRRLAAHALAEIGPAAREAVPALIEAVQDPESFVRVWAAA